MQMVMRCLFPCVLALMLASCGGAGYGVNLGASDGGGRAASFTAYDAGTASREPLAVTVEPAAENLLVRVAAPAGFTGTGVFVELSYDADRYRPVAAQATEALAPLPESLVLKVLDVPGTVAIGQQALNASPRRLPDGATVVEVLFAAEPFATGGVSRSVSAVPVNAYSISPLTWDSANNELRWYYVLHGDYDQNGEVGIADLAPLAAHFGEAGPFAFTSVQSIIDGNSDGEIGAADLATIAQELGATIQGYQLYASTNVADIPASYAEPSVIEPLAGFMLADNESGPGERLSFSHQPGPEEGGMMFWVRPFAADQSGELKEGTRSNINGPGAGGTGGGTSGNPNPDFNLPPAADLTLHYTGSAIPLTVQLDGAGSTDPDGSIVFFEWDFEGDGLVDAYGVDPQVTHVYTQPGEYAPVLRVTDNNGAWSTFISPAFTATVSAVSNIEPSADLFATDQSGYAPLTTGLIANGSRDIDGFIAEYHWDFDGDGTVDFNSGTDPSVLHTFNVPGTFNAEVEVVDDRGGTASASLELIVLDQPQNQLPQAEFDGNPLTGNIPLEVSFDAAASVDPDGSITEYAWDMDGDGGYDTFTTVSAIDHTFTAPGTTAVSLRVTDNSGATASAVVEVSANVPGNTLPTADLAATPANGVVPLSVGFDAAGSTDSDGSIVRYDFDFDNDGAWDAYDASPSINWTYTEPGAYTARVRVTDDQGAQDTAQLLVETNAAGNALPVVQVTATPSSGDAPLSVLLDASGSSDPDGGIVAYEWDFNGDNIYDGYGAEAQVLRTFTAPGLVDVRVRVTDTSGAQAVNQVAVNVASPSNTSPTAVLLASPPAGVVPLEINLDAASSIDPDGSIVNYEWDFNGDGLWDGYGSQATLNHTYTNQGTFEARMRVTDNDGAQSVATFTLNLVNPDNPTPTAVLVPSVPSGVAPLTVVFDASGSSDPNGSIVNYEWDFNGDGLFDAYGSQPSASRTYTDPGVFDVKLRVTDNGGAQALAVAPLSITLPGNALPSAQLTASPASGNVPLAVALDASGSTDGDGSINQYEWDFNGDGLYDGYGTQPAVSHLFTAPGSFTVKVRVTDNGGAQATATAEVNANQPGNQPPEAALMITPGAGPAPLTAQLNGGNSVDPDGSIVKYEWDFNGDGLWDGYSEQPAATHLYTTPGLFSVRLRVTDNGGSQGQASFSLNVTGSGPGGQAPIAALTATPTRFSTAPVTVSLNPGGSTDPDGSLIRYDWDWESDGLFDATSYSDSPVNHVFSTLVAHQVTLRVTDDDNLFSSASVSITPDIQPVADLVLNPNPAGLNEVVSVDASGSSDPAGAIIKYEFDLNGDGIYELDNGANPVTSTSFASAGDYIVRVRVTDNDNNITTDSVIARISFATITSIGGTATADGPIGFALIGGHPAICFYETVNDDLKYVRATNPEGTAWGQVVTIASNNNSGQYCDLVEANGRPAVIYRDATADRLYYVRAGDATGSSWSTPVLIHSGVTLSADLEIIGGRPAVTYFALGSNSLMYRRASNADGSLWNAAFTVNSGGFNGGIEPSLAEVNGMPAIAYFYWDGTAGIRYRRASNIDGTTWNAAVNVAFNAVVNNSYDDAALAVVAGFPAVVYHNLALDSVCYKRATDVNGTAFGSEVSIKSGGDYGDDTGLVFFNNKPLAAFNDNSNQDLLVSFGSDATGSSFDASQLVDGASSGAGYNLQIKVMNGEACLVYQNSAAPGNLCFARLN